VSVWLPCGELSYETERIVSTICYLRLIETRRIVSQNEKGGSTMRLIPGLVVAAAVASLAVATALAHPDSRAVVRVGPSSLGRVLVNAQGKTLYMWAHDRGTKSTCNGDCAEYWPPLVTTGAPQAVAGADPRLLGTTTRADGRRQVTYHGHPLYTFVKDTRAGQTAGEGLTGFGGRWDPVSAAGAPVRKGPAPATYDPPLQAVVLSPSAGDVAGAGGAFNVDVSLHARTKAANPLLSAAAGYEPFFNDPSADTFHPGPDIGAPGLVVMLSTTPTIDGTPLQGPNTNLAGVFQLNTVVRSKGLNQTLNTWQVSVPGFFGTNKQAVLTVFAVGGTAPAVVPATGIDPISNVAKVPFTIAP
jgi:predicted lipoprotein with Yx(FWY)xxD motif